MLRPGVPGAASDQVRRGAREENESQRSEGLPGKYRMERNRKTYLIKDTRGIIDAILNGDILNAPTKTLPYFNVEIPTELPGVDPAILDPRDTYADASEWETKAKDLADRFIKNFAKYESNELGKALVAAGPQE